MYAYDWFPLYQQAMLEFDPQKHSEVIQAALKALAERLKALPDKSDDERMAILTAATTLADLRRHAEAERRDDEFLAQAG